MVQDIITTVIDVITGLLAGLGTGIVGYFEAVFLNANQDGLNSVGTFIFVLLGISTALGLSALVFNMVRNRK